MAAGINTRLLEAFQGGGGIAYPRAEVWHVTNGKTADLHLTGAKVTFDLGASIPRTCQLTLAGFAGILPDTSQLGYRGTFADTNGSFGDGIFGDELGRELRGLLVPGPNQVRLFLRVVFGEGDYEEIPMGRYDIAKPSFRHTRAGGIEASITGYDVARRVRKSGYRVPYTVEQGTNVATAVQALLQSRVPGVSFWSPSTSFVTPDLTFLPVQGVDPLADAQELAYSAGWILSTTRDGGIIANHPLDPGTGAAAWTATQATITSLEVGQDDEDAINVLVITGHRDARLDEDGEPIVYEDGSVATAKDLYGSASLDSGQWGTSQLGERVAVEESEYVYSDQQAAVMAQTKLPKYLGFVDRATLVIPFAPHLDHGDLIRIDDPDLNLEEAPYLAERVEHDLGAKTTSITVSRRLV